MASELDRALDAILDRLTAPGQPFETKPIERFGATIPAFAHCPPSLAHYFAHYCAEHADKPFLVDGDMRLTFAEAHAAAGAAARGLIARHGIRPGDMVGLAARNSANWILAFMGIAMAGGCAALLNGFWEGAELAEGVALADCKLVLADEARAKRLAEAGCAAKVVRFGHGGAANDGLGEIMPRDDAADVALPELGPSDLATLLYTSGSTGRSKGAYSDQFGVMHGTMSFAAQTLMVYTMLELRGEAPSVQPCALVTIPLFHVTGLVPLFMQSFALGRKLVLMPRWDAREAMRLMEAEQVTYFLGVPLMSYEIATHPERHRFDLTACASFAAGGAPRPEDHVVKIRDSFPKGFPLIGYGLTETNAVGCGNINENYLDRPGSTGKPSRPIVEVAIMDEAGTHLAQGETGEVCIRSAANFLGYWDNEDATRAAMTADGYFRTGDLGRFDADGYLTIVDRKKDIIIRGGENIACIEVEEAIYAHPAIAECSVFGVPDERLGEVPAVVYATRAKERLEPDELRKFLEGRIAQFKVPQYAWSAPGPLPRLGTQKIDKRTLRETYVARLGGS